MSPTRILTVLTIVGVAFFSAILGIHLARLRTQRRIARHRRVGRAGAERGLKLLGRAGYRIVDTEVAATGAIEVDGVRREYSVRADAIVKKRFRRYVAEFKGGACSASPANRDTRRQLLEYATLFDVHGILLVDADAGKILRIRFPFLSG